MESAEKKHHRLKVPGNVGDVLVTQYFLVCLNRFEQML